MNKKNNKLTFSALMASLSCVVMLVSYFPYFTYAVPAIAGLFIMVIVIEINCKWASGAYLASVLPVFLFAETESKFMYIGFLGFYPILKALVERIRKSVLEWIIKLICFNISVFAIYFVLSKVIGFSAEDFGALGEYGTMILLVLGNIAFVLYDIAISRMAIVYMNLVRPKLKKIIK